jgi:cold shock CspA family protein
MNGIVKRYNAVRGYGFIAPLIGKPSETPELFFHINSCKDEVAPPVGCEVKFQVLRANGGRVQAWGVEVVEIQLLRSRTEPRQITRAATAGASAVLVSRWLDRKSDSPNG